MSFAADIILVSELPSFELVEGELQFTLTSGSRVRVFRISRHKARSAIHVAARLLDEADRAPSNVRSLKGRTPRHRV